MTELKGLKIEERISAVLAALYSGRGYKRYKLKSFEEYSVYLDNKDFLIGKNVITFGGLDGKLLALRPDVTLSIIKNVNTDETKKLFYNENVYRAIGEEYKEVSQTGVEVIGEIDLVTEAEVTALALSTLGCVGKNYLLDLSHMGFVSALISSFNVGAEEREALYRLLKTKNTHDILKLVPSLGEENAVLLSKLIEINGSPAAALKEAEKICVNEEMRAALAEMKALVNALSRSENINVNFSIANNADYYNGIIFNGYIGGVPHSVLSGGRYDKLLEKFGKNAGAIGFALYLGELERLFSEPEEKIDALIIYGENAAEALSFADKFIKDGKSVRLSKSVPKSGIFGKTYKIVDGELKCST